MKPDHINNEAKKQIKAVLTYLILVNRSFNLHRIFRTLVSGDQNFQKMAITPLEEIDLDYLNEQNRKKIINILKYLRSAVKMKHLDLYEKIFEDEFESEVIAPLKKLSGWDKKDEATIDELYRDLTAETRNDAPKKNNTFGIVKTGLKIAAGGAVIWGIYKATKKK